MDTVRCLAWQQAEDLVIKHAYVNVAAVSRELSAEVSLRQIAVSLGISKDTVRLTKKFTDGTDVGTKRVRLLKDGLARALKAAEALAPL
jgi:hypothetical protein